MEVRGGASTVTIELVHGAKKEFLECSHNHFDVSDGTILLVDGLSSTIATILWNYTVRMNNAAKDRPDTQQSKVMAYCRELAYLMMRKIKADLGDDEQLQLMNMSCKTALLFTRISEHGLAETYISHASEVLSVLSL